MQGVRTMRGVSAADMTRLCGFAHQTTVDRLEAGRLPRSNDVLERYLAALASPLHLPPELALTAEQVALLRRLYQAQRAHRPEAAEASALAISTRNLLLDHCPPALAPLVRQLGETPYPALIFDDFWFDHAINGTLCNVFDIQRTPIAGTTRLRLPDLFYQRWEMWHSIGIKIPRDSPLRQGYVLSDAFFLPLTLQAFFQDPRIALHLFGAPIRGQSLPFKLTIPSQVQLRQPGGYTTTYALAVWLPDSDHTARVVGDLRDPAIYYAADHDAAR
ncbi:MAG: hypothetical protein N2378_05300 [Chloroflexaceae bacterium]|nr:hypothetical protein [Chloroflexaceae bacterium]